MLALEIDIINSLKYNVTPVVPAEVCAALVSNHEGQLSWNDTE